jgi:hypothetical protein
MRTTTQKFLDERQRDHHQREPTVLSRDQQFDRFLEPSAESFSIGFCDQHA